MENAIIFSLKPKFADLIEKRKKDYEFRKYRPQQPINKIYVYVTSPVCELKYILDVKEPIEYPNKIPETGIGNKDFNDGLKVSKFAYEIRHLYKLNKPVDLKNMRERFNLQPPQGYVYAENYKDLCDYINTNCDVELSF